MAPLPPSRVTDRFPRTIRRAASEEALSRVYAAAINQAGPFMLDHERAARAAQTVRDFVALLDSEVGS